MTARRVAGALLAVVLAAGCLPETGRRDVGSGSAGGPSATPVQPTPSPAPTGPTPRPSFVPPTPTPAPTFLVYVVVRGDSLNTIAHRYGTSARSIAFWNRATYPSLDPLSPGYRPGVVQPGWTLVLVPNLLFDEDSLVDPTPNPASPDAPSPDSSDAAPSG